MYTKLPELFRPPAQAADDDRAGRGVPREGGPPGAQYEQGTPDGARPGMVQVNTYEATKRLTIDMESTAYHEGVPGHHPADRHPAGARRAAAVPPAGQLRRVLRGLGAVLRAARQGGRVLPGPVQRLRPAARPRSCARSAWWSTPACTPSTGPASRSSSSSTTTRRSRSRTSRPRPPLQIAIPGQALGYKIGQLTILRLRDKDRGRARQANSTSARSTTRCSAPGRCRSTSWSAGSTPGSPRAERDRRRGQERSCLARRTAASRGRRQRPQDPGEIVRLLVGTVAANRTDHDDHDEPDVRDSLC